MGLLLAVCALAGFMTGVGLVGYGVGRLGRVGPRRAGREVWLRCLGALLGAVAVGAYTWGLLIATVDVGSAADGGTGSAPYGPCRTPGQEERAGSVTGYTVDFVPLRFVCETEDGGSYAAGSVPGYLNPAVVGFGLAAVLCVGAAAVTSERRARRNGEPATL